MRTVWKFDLQLLGGGWVTVPIPTGGVVLHVGTQDATDNAPSLWVLVDPSAPTEDRTFHIRGTGHDVDPRLVHVGSVVGDRFVWHVFEESHPG